MSTDGQNHAWREHLQTLLADGTLTAKAPDIPDIWDMVYANIVAKCHWTTMQAGGACDETMRRAAHQTAKRVADAVVETKAAEESQ